MTNVQMVTLKKYTTVKKKTVTKIHSKMLSISEQEFYFCIFIQLRQNKMLKNKYKELAESYALQSFLEAFLFDGSSFKIHSSGLGGWGLLPLSPLFTAPR